MSQRDTRIIEQGTRAPFTRMGKICLLGTARICAMAGTLMVPRLSIRRWNLSVRRQAIGNEPLDLLRATFRWFGMVVRPCTKG